jgi:uncharacterized protein (DUF58 family)
VSAPEIGGADAAGAPLLDDAFLRRLERLALRTRRVAGLVGGRAGPRHTPAADFVDHRPYSPGDDQRHIDWPGVARHDEVFVKVGRTPQAAQVHLVLDTTRSMTMDRQKHRFALQLTAALGWMSLVHGDRLTLAPLPGDAGAPPWGPGLGARRGAEFLAYVARLPEAAADHTALLPTLRAMTHRARVGGLVVIVSDLWLSDDLDLALAQVPPPRWELLVLQVLGRVEINPTLDGAIELVDAETGARVPVFVDDAARAAYRRALAERLERIRTGVVARGGQHALVPTDWSLERAVVPYLQRRALLAT